MLFKRVGGSITKIILPFIYKILQFLKGNTRAINFLNEKKINSNNVYNFQKEINKILENFKNVYVVEDHLSSNGLYDSICNLIINSNINFNLISISPKDYDLEVGTDLKYFFKKHNLDIESVKSKVK